MDIASVIIFFLATALLCLVSDNDFASTREELENTIKQQKTQIEELERDKDQLSSSLVQSRETTLYLEQEVRITDAFSVIVCVLLSTQSAC